MSTKIAARRPVYGLGAGFKAGGASGPVYTIGSGPASGVVGGVFIGELAGYDDLICVDMGGTTCLCSLVDTGEARIVSETTLGNRLKLPMIDVRTIGAGGGSIGWVDPQGVLHVGPKSAAAIPGPACYGFGGKEPTVTDANLFLGMLDKDFYLGGRMKVYPEKSKEALSRLSDKLGHDAVEAAAGVIRIVESNMINNISEVSVWRGYDPRDLTLVAFGGGSGLHCVRMAAELGTRTVVSPPYPAILSALGHIVSDIKHFFSRSFLKELSSELLSINEFYDSQESEAERMIRSELPEDCVIHAFKSFDMRYRGQTHEIRIDVPNRELVEGDRTLLADRFNAKHSELYGYPLPQYPIEIVTLRLEVVGSSPTVHLRRNPKTNREPSAGALRKRRDIYLLEKESFVTVNCYEREKLRSGNEVRGPSLVEGLEATVLVPEGWDATIDEYSNLIIQQSK